MKILLVTWISLFLAAGICAISLLVGLIWLGQVTRACIQSSCVDAIQKKRKWLVMIIAFLFTIFLLAGVTLFVMYYTTSQKNIAETAVPPPTITTSAPFPPSVLLALQLIGIAVDADNTVKAAHGAYQGMDRPAMAMTRLANLSVQSGKDRDVQSTYLASLRKYAAGYFEQLVSDNAVFACVMLSPSSAMAECLAQTKVSQYWMTPALVPDPPELKVEVPADKADRMHAIIQLYNQLAAAENIAIDSSNPHPWYQADAYPYCQKLLQIMLLNENVWNLRTSIVSQKDAYAYMTNYIPGIFRLTPSHRHFSLFLSWINN